MAEINPSEYLSAFPYQERTAFGQTMDDFTIAMGPGDYLFIDYVLSRHKAINRAIELGTFRGLTTLYLGICMLLRGGDVITFDRDVFTETKVVISWPRNVTAEICDALQSPDRVIKVITDRTMFICDDGDKLAEARLYAKYITGDAIMLVHDADQEYPAAELLASMADAGLTELYGEISSGLSSSFRAFYRENK